MKKEEEWMDIDEPVDKIVSQIMDRLRDTVFDHIEEVWEDGIPDSWIEREIKNYVKLYWDMEVPETLFEAIWEAIDWQEIEDIEMEAMELEKEWTQEQGPFGSTGYTQSDFI